MSTVTEHDEQVAADQAAMEEARTIAAGVADAEAQDRSDSSTSTETPERELEPLTWADVKAGDTVEILAFGAEGWTWHRREVLSVDGGMVNLRDVEHGDEYELDVTTDVWPLRWAEVPIEEDPDGQQRIGGPGTEPTFSTDAGGSAPHEAELSLKAKKIEWPTDLRRGSQVLLLAWAYVDEVRVGSGSKTFVAEIGRQMVVEHPTMRPLEVMDALSALESRQQRDRAVIDQSAKIAAELVDRAGGIVDLDLAVAMRERLYDRYGIDDDAFEATHGTPDHQEESENDPRSIGEIVQDEVDSIDAAEAAAAAEGADGQEAD